MNQPVERGLFDGLIDGNGPKALVGAVKVGAVKVGAGLGGISLNVNGKHATLTCAPAKRLVYALREDLGLTGTKVG